ncbi:phosphonate C-P lyase system protein PhnG [Neoaquamicrobium sediminum]|uniref:Phosphonate C-P lyase system protein PhnG n=1 Tax=Neoaquamicrobium sediminum TaxID=1849104 RepID=A0ABV3WNT0_9HYPH
MRHSNRGDKLGEHRRAAMAIVAAAPAAQLRRCWNEAAITAEAETLRGPETGLVAVRGRIGGGGAPFNVGEATVTRATVRLASGEVGHAYLLGRDAERARLAATVDALLQRADKAGEVEERVLAPLRALNAAEENRRRAETAATKVDFFTVARGED